jgi:hypothetical protein
MDARARMEIEWECRNLCYGFAHYIDSRRYAELTALFTQNGVFNRVGQVLNGHGAILAALEQRSLEMRTRHVCHNIYFSEVSEKTARALVYNTTLTGLGDPPSLPVPYGLTQGVFLEFRDIYCLTAEGWRIAERVASIVLTPSDMPQH